MIHFPYTKEDWESWKQQFKTGKTIPVYFNIVSFVMLAVLMFLNYGNIYQSLAFFIAVLASYAVFTDQVAHLFVGNEKPDMSLRAYIGLIFSIKKTGGRWKVIMRTHDVYGMSISVVASYFALHWLVIPTVILNGVVVFYFIKCRFYH